MMEIKVNNITKKFKDKIALDGVSFTVKEGELFGLLGTNGAGKTTLVKILSTLLRATDGSANIFGLDTQIDAYKIREIINVCPQETAVAPNLSVLENLNFMAGVYKIENKEQVINELIQTFKFNEVLKKKAKTLSGGWQRKLSIALSLISSPKVLFLDEPTLGLDVISRKELWKVIENLKGKMTIFLTTHYMEEAESLCDRVAILCDGKLKALDTPKNLIKASKKTSFEDAFIAIVTEGKL